MLKVCFGFTAYDKKHHKELLREFRKSVANGTWRNRRIHLEKLLQFCDDHGLNPLRLGEYDILSYILFLKKSFKAPSSVHNYLSGARTWFLSVTGNAAPFDTYKVKLFKRGLRRTMIHETTRVSPFNPEHLIHIMKVLGKLGREVLVLKSFITIAFFSALRQGNLLLRNESDKPIHTLKAADVMADKNQLRLLVRSSKTRTKNEPPISLVLPKLKSSKCCPLKNWREYDEAVTSRRRNLAFVRSDGAPLTSRVATTVLRIALEGSTYPNPKKFTLHACRRGAAQALAAKGASLKQVQRLGQWTSKSVYTYVPKSNIVVEAETLKTYFG